MSPTEKAKELYQKFSFTAKSFIWGKQCAILAVDIILIDVGAKDWSGDIACEGRNYWQEVKIEIEKL
jgi:hypothetical protein